ncbi:SPAC4G8.04 [Symbiodinium pilosum]|uniref:SPAC4G8.04 protein n=1 Tax=Symbiodinium pilosum TaxID=2952 RepID=A0A812Y5K6_SYMPI|nr:SPAC4G8.04 [Symbiodinium pilosum]
MLAEPDRSPGPDNLNLKVQQLEATLVDLRRDVVGCVDSQEQVEKLLQSLQRDCTEVQEKVRLQMVASEEQRSLHQVISQSAGDLGRGIEEVSAAMMQAETNMRQAEVFEDGSLPVLAEVPAPLDPNFAPLILGKRNYLKAVAASGSKATLDWALPRADGCARYTLPVFPDDSAEVEASIYLAGVLIQEQIWQRSAKSLLLCGPAKICEALKKEYSMGGTYEFEVKSMPNVCGTPDVAFSVAVVASAAELPAASDTPQVCGKDASGCRLAFDLGKSDIKTVAVKDNEVVYSKETEWDVTNVDPDYHFKAIVDALKLAKEKLPKVQAIGGSATGTVGANNEATWCDIFPNVPPPVYKAKVVDIFQRISKELAGDVPLKVINDGEVTALAAVQKLGGKGNVMGISMGSSEGGGYANADGNLMGWINELCYVKLDLNPEAPTDPWTKGAHTGVSHMYLGQRGATKLAAKAGVKVPPNYVYPHPDMCTIKHEDHAQCLKLIQKAMEDPSVRPQVEKLYRTIGVYLGYALAQYSEFYKIDHVMILGRVSKGAGGDIMLNTAKEVLQTEFPEFAGIQFHTADDHFKAGSLCPRDRNPVHRVILGIWWLCSWCLCSSAVLFTWQA